MRILLLGKGGQLGWEAQRSLACLGDVIAVDAPQVDFTRLEDLRQFVLESKPKIIFNAAAYTAVDQAEMQTEKARLINATAPRVLAEAARQLNAVLVHISTDYVFDGEKGAPYVESDLPRPLNAYGQTKLEGELAVQDVGGAYLILRTAWVYSKRQESFVGKVLSWGHSQKTLKVVSDQLGSPTWARLLAEASALVLSQGVKDMFAWGGEHAGVYHLAGDGTASRLEWAREILRLDPRQNEQVCTEVLAAKTADFPTPAQRPLATPLDSSLFYRTFGIRLGNWQQGLKLALG
jgi:dTDP-4-dehydrorhamnose reductase